MVKLVAALALILTLVAQKALAQEGDPMAEAMAQNPQRFEARMVDLVAGFGGAQGLTPAGIEEHVALERAAARASAMRRFLAMDLDGDGAVARAELLVVQRAASASGRGRLERTFAAADMDGDGQVSGAEMTAAGAAAAIGALGEAEAEMLRSLMQLDADRSGAVTADEVRAAVARSEPGEET